MHDVHYLPQSSCITLKDTHTHNRIPVCLLPPPGLLTVSQLSSSRLQLTLPTTVWGVSPAPPFGFRLLASASGSASLVHFPSSSSRLPSPPWPSPGFSRSPGSVLSSSPRRSRQTSLGPVPRHSLRSLGLPRGFPSLRVPLLGFVSALPSGSLSGSLLGPFWGRLSWPPSHTSPVGQSTLAVSRLFMTCRGSGPIHTSRDRAPPSLPRLRGFSPHFVRAPPSLLFTSCTSFLSPILSLP